MQIKSFQNLSIIRVVNLCRCVKHEGSIYMRNKMKEIFLFFLLFAGTYLYAQSRGEALFKENNAKDAVQVLEYEILNGQISENTYNFLGLGYYQLEEYDKSLDAFRRGIKAQPENTKILSYNMGNTYYALKDYTSAVNCYSDSLKADPLFYDALLNRANALLMSGQLLTAKEEYIDFIAKAPDNPQRERIELLIKALEEEIARREEEARLLAEQNKAKWEEYDGNLSERKNENFMPSWEEVEHELSDNIKEKDDTEWEKISGENPELTSGHLNSVELKNEDDKKETFNDFWEEFDNDGNSLVANSEKITDEEDWLSLSDAELNEIKELDKRSQEEHEKWLEDERRRAQEIAAREAQTKQKEREAALEEEKRLREELLEEMRQAEDERRKKLLEDVANSLQGSDSTNLTSGAEDLIDYDLEGELD